MDYLPEVFDSKARLRDLTKIEVENLPPDDLERFEALRDAYVQNRTAEENAAALAKENVVLSAQVRTERLERQRQKPVSQLQIAREWIATCAENNRRERGL